MSTTFKVEIAASDVAGGCNITASGRQIDNPITELDANEFGFGDKERITRACGSMIGENPKKWFLHNPTMPHPNSGDHAYDNAYDKYGWQPVTVILQPISAEFLGIHTEPVIVHHVEWINETNYPRNYTADMTVKKTESVSQSVSSSTTIGTDLTVGVEVLFNVERSFNFSMQWGDTRTETRDIELGVNAGANATLEPHSRETAYLWADLGSARFRVTYQASLSGHVMTINDPPRRGFTYRGLFPDHVLAAAGLPSTKTIQYDHIVHFYSSQKVTVAPGPYNPNHEPPSDVLAPMIFAPTPSEKVSSNQFAEALLPESGLRDAY